MPRNTKYQVGRPGPPLKSQAWPVGAICRYFLWHMAGLRGYPAVSAAAAASGAASSAATAAGAAAPGADHMDHNGGHRGQHSKANNAGGKIHKTSLRRTARSQSGSLRLQNSGSASSCTAPAAGRRRGSVPWISPAISVVDDFIHDMILWNRGIGR